MGNIKPADSENFLQSNKKLTLLFLIRSVHEVVKNEEMKKSVLSVIISKKGNNLGYLEH